MMPRYKSAICIFGKYMQNNLPLMLGPINYPVLNDSSQQVRTIKKHWNPKFRKQRKEKVMKVELPKFVHETGELDPDVIRTRLKQRGLLPQRNWQERSVFISCTPQIFESYVVPEGDGKFSAISIKGAKQKFEFIEKKSKSFIALRKIKSYEDFKSKLFVEEALDIYKKAHEALCNKDEDEMLQYVTEHAYPMMTHNMMDKTIVWKFLESLEPPRIVHVRVASVITKQNQFAQVTVRFHSQQILCIYDRFGRLLLGSETVKKDVLDYIVFEKHLSNTYGVWRIHGKIIPNWMEPNEIPLKTCILPKEESSISSESLAENVPADILNAKVTDASTD